MLIAISMLAVAQTVRGFLLALEYNRWEQTEFNRRTFEFGGHNFAIEDDQPTDSVSRQKEFPGTVRLIVDGRPFGAPTHAGVRRGLPDAGRYHSWVSVLQFREIATNSLSLWIDRKIEPSPSASTRYEITAVSADGTITQRTLPGWRLGFDYRTTEVTGLLVLNEWSVFPLSLDVFLYFPYVLLAFPIGTTILGVYLVRKQKISGSH